MVKYFKIWFVCATGELVGDAPDHHPTDARGPQSCPLMHPARGPRVLEHGQLQRCHGNRSRSQVSFRFLFSICAHTLVACTHI
jgi:hypothetical protein